MFFPDIVSVRLRAASDEVENDVHGEADEEIRPDLFGEGLRQRRVAGLDRGGHVPVRADRKRAPDDSQAETEYRQCEIQSLGWHFLIVHVHMSFLI